MINRRGGDSMAKKSIKKSTKVVKKTTASSAHHNDFILIVGGGFVVIALMFLMTNGFGTWGVKSMDESKMGYEKKMVVEENVVVIKDAAFNPETITIKKGDSVTFDNMDSIPHQLMANDESFDTGVIEMAGKASVMFDTVQTVTYTSVSDPLMMGTIIVQE